MAGPSLWEELLEDEAASVACRSSLDSQRPHATLTAFERPHCRWQQEATEVPGSAVPAIHSPPTDLMQPTAALDRFI